MKAFCIIFITIITFMAVAYAKQSETPSTDKNVLEERIKQNEEKVNIKEQNLKESLSKTEENLNRKIDDLDSKLKDLMDRYLTIVLSFIGIVGALISFFGSKIITSWLEKNLDEFIRKKITVKFIDDRFKSVIKEKKLELKKKLDMESERLIIELTNQQNNILKDNVKRFDKLFEDYKENVKKLSEQKIDPSQPMTDELKEEISNYVKSLVEIKNESEYNYFDYMQMAQNEVSNGDYNKVIQFLDKSIALNPNNFYSWYNKGYSLNQLGKFEEAIICFDKAIELKPDSYIAWINRGYSLTKIRKDDEAIVNYDKAIELMPDSDIAWNNKGNSLYILRKFDDAILCFDKAIELNPNSFNPLNNKGSLLNELGEYDEAIIYFNKAIELKPDSPNAWINKGFSNLKSGNYNESINCFNKAIELKADNIESFLNLSELYVTLNKFKDAEIVLAKGLKLTETNDNIAIYLFLKIIIDIMLGKDTKESEKKFEEIIYKDFKTIWDFEEIEKWLDKTDIEHSKKEIIIGLIEKLKQHK